MAWKIEICKKYINLGYSTSKVLEYAGVSSSTWYSFLNKDGQVRDDKRKNNLGRKIPGFCFDSLGNKISDAKIILYLKKYREASFFNNGGRYIKLTHYLRRDYWLIVNKKKIYRLCKIHKLLLAKRKKNKWRNRKICTNKVVNEPNQLWQFDIKYGYIHGETRYFFFLGFIDVFTRKIVSYYTSCFILKLLASSFVFKRLSSIKNPFFLEVPLLAVQRGKYDYLFLCGKSLLFFLT